MAAPMDSKAVPPLGLDSKVLGIQVAKFDASANCDISLDAALQTCIRDGIDLLYYSKDVSITTSLGIVHQIPSYIISSYGNKYLQLIMIHHSAVVEAS